MMVKPEILSPAGDFEKLRYAVAYGADAVYMAGRSYGMRTASGNFEHDEIAQAVRYCHDNRAKCFITVNVMPRNGEIDALPGYLEYLNDTGADALIIADIGVLPLAKKYAPNVRVHISTQASVVNYSAASMYHSLGADRIVLARELTLEDIVGIRAKTPPQLELETFVHGAMCMSYSGRCLLSNFMTGRDANHGNCAQPCRWKYYLMEEKRPGEYMPVFEDEQGSFILNSKDLCMIEHIPDLMAAGIDSFKIEGRVKTAYYAAAVTGAYRRAVDFHIQNPGTALPPEIASEVEKVSHREYYTGFYYGHSDGQHRGDSTYVRSWDVCADIGEKQENGLYRLTQKNKCSPGDEVELLSPGRAPVAFTLGKLTDEQGISLLSAPHPEMAFFTRLPCEAPEMSILRKRNS